MPEVQVRKKFTAVEEIFHEGGPVSSRPLRRAAALAVIRNPFAGEYVKEIAGFMDDLKPLGLEMAQSLIAALGGDPKVVEGYGKGAIMRMGEDGMPGAMPISSSSRAPMRSPATVSRTPWSARPPISRPARI